MNLLLAPTSSSRGRSRCSTLSGPVTGLGFRGTVGRLLEVIIHQEHTLVTSEYILEELRRKIGEKFQGAQKEAALDLLLFILSRVPLEAKKEVQ